ncbi:hypothetical protein AXF42_Ash016278 [Apostasia shenzhenica]|uniref:Uncharacterized protein n=1 Tax=Apostasia shenzhenica TaxID=1088818 RepID=A0A2H9ZXE2_9ASPA|nr:hypothetical protein AXF42_Ash016278 [Apostasia shenzhenica]
MAHILTLRFLLTSIGKRGNFLRPAANFVVPNGIQADVLARYKPTIDVPTLIQDMKHTSKLIEDALQHFNGTRHILLYYEEIIRNQTVYLLHPTE